MGNARNMRGCFLTLTAVLLISLVIGCEEKVEGPGSGDTGTMVIAEIILNPKSPALGDTMRLTAVITGVCPSDAPECDLGEAPKYSWTASVGTLLETDKAVVRWVAPMSSELVPISVSAANSVSSSSASTTIFVNNIQQIIASDGGELHISSTGDSVISQFSPVAPGNVAFEGWGVRVNDGTNESIVLPPSTGAGGIRFSKQLDRFAYTTPGDRGRGLITLSYVEMATGIAFTIPPTLFGQRGPKYTNPDFLPGNSQLLTYATFWPDQIKPLGVGVDTTEVAVYDILTNKEKRVVTQGRSSYPTFSTDGRWLTFVSDRHDQGKWEYHAVAVNGTQVATDSIDGSIQLTSTGGSMLAGLPRAWNPQLPILAALDKGGALQLVQADGSGTTQVAAAGVVREFAWAPAGNFLVMAVGNLIYRVTTAGAATVIHTATVGDRVGRLAVSADENFLVFLATRLAQNWYELLDLSGVTGLTTTVRVSPSGDVGNATNYAAEFSLVPIWLPNEAKVHLLFFDGGDTPRISTLDFNSLVP